jgi:taurine dioxygenase
MEGVMGLPIFQPLCKAIGALVEGIDLNADLTPETADALYEGLMRYHTLVFRRQPLTPEAHIALAESFGPVVPFHPFYPSIEGHAPVAVIHDKQDSPPENDMWHSDLSATKAPPFGSVLHSKIIPPVGGDTLWCSMHAVYDSLSPAMQRYLQGLEAAHELMSAYGHNLKNNKFDQRTEILRNASAEELSVRHPVVMAHPTTGRPLIYVNGAYTARVIDVPESESRRILDMLYAATDNPHFSFRLHWEPDTVVIWDNYATQHLALRDHYPQPRKVQRVTIAKDRRAVPQPLTAKAS